MRRIAILAAAAFLVASPALAAGGNSAPTVGMDRASGKPTLLDLGAGYCSSCKEMKAILGPLEKEYRGRVNVVIVDVNEEPDLARTYRVQMIPTQIFFDAHGKEMKRHIGAMDKGEIVKELKALGVR
jgi:thioredoxin 1